MRLGLSQGQWTTGMVEAVSRAREAERLGYHPLGTLGL